VIAVNMGKARAPVEVDFGVQNNDPVLSLLDNRALSVMSGVITDTIEAYGVRVYRQ
jgi:hypothetical protein